MYHTDNNHKTTKTMVMHFLIKTELPTLSPVGFLSQKVSINNGQPLKMED